MNIIFFTQEDPFYVKVFFDEFFRLCDRLNEIKAVVISRPMGKKSLSQLAGQMYQFYGARDFVQVGCRFVWKKLMGRRKVRVGRGAELPKTHTVRQLCDAYGLKVFERSDINSPGFQEMIRAYSPDLFISVASPIIFRDALIVIPRLATINIHNAPLPNYRGMLPNFWQLYHGEKQAGITIHKIDTGIDTGDIVEQRFVPIDESDSLDDLIVKTKRLGAGMMLEVIEKFRNNTVSCREMPSGGSYFSFPGRADVLEFKRRGKRLL